MVFIIMEVAGKEGKLRLLPSKTCLTAFYMHDTGYLKRKCTVL